MVADRLDEGETPLETPFVQIVEEQSAHTTLLAAMFEVEIVIAPLFVTWIDLRPERRAGCARRAMPGHGVFLEAVIRRQIETAAKPPNRCLSGGGGDEQPDIDLKNPDGYEVNFGDYDWELDSLDDGCWADWEFPDGMSDEDSKAIEAAWDENWYEGMEELGWSNDDTEYHFYGPLRLENESTGEVFEGEPDA